MAFLVGLVTAIVYGGCLLGLSYLACYGYTGNYPVHAWPLVLGATIAGLCKGVDAANKWDD